MALVVLSVIEQYRELVTRCAAIVRLTTQLASRDDRPIAAGLTPAADGLRPEVHGDDRLARRALARQDADDTFTRAFVRRILPAF